MKIHFVMGGDAQSQKSYYEGFDFPEKTVDKLLECIKKIFPFLKSLLFADSTQVHELPCISCCACQYAGLTIRKTLEKTLTLTHIHYSMRIISESSEYEKEEVYLFCSACAIKILVILRIAQKFPLVEIDKLIDLL